MLRAVPSTIFMALSTEDAFKSFSFSSAISLIACGVTLPTVVALAWADPFSTAAAFLKQFVPKRGEGEDAEDIPWAHLDIAGTAWGAKSNKLVPHGATGIHVRTLHKLITEL